MLSTFVTLAALHAGSLGISAPAPVDAVAEPVPAITEQTDLAVPSVVPKAAAPAPLIRVQGEGLPAEPDGELVPSDTADTPEPRADATAPTEANRPEADTDSSAPGADPRAQLIAPPDAPATPSPTERRAIVKAAGEALSRVETATGRFVQVDASGHLTEGSFALKRPGRMRFDYDSPTPLLIAADGATVAIRDSELETVDRVPLASTPLGLILDDNLDFEKEAEIIDVRKANGVVAVSMRDRSGEAEGTLTLIFDAGSYQLVSWRAQDANGGLTTVRLSDVRTGISLNPRLFIVEDFEDEEDDRRR